MCRVVAWIVPRLILMILILMAICCAMILLALPPLWILMILVAICCAVFLLALPLRILMSHDASGYWNAGKWWSGYFHLLLKKESRNRESIILVRPRGFPRETRLMFILNERLFPRKYLEDFTSVQQYSISNDNEPFSKKNTNLGQLVQIAKKSLNIAIF